MLKIDGLEIEEEIHNSQNSIIYKANDKANLQSKVLKILKDSSPSPEKLQKFFLEFQILKKFNHEGIVKPIQILEINGSNPVFIMDYGGESIRKILFKKKFSIEELLNISIQVADILAEVHSKKVIHKDINPSNILYDLETKKVKMIDFGISSIISKEKEIFKNPNVLEGTISYISPEQSGRMNRIIDYRTDFYSLGVTLFELFTNNLPFVSDDPMELIHKHIAEPIPQIQSEIPISIIKIIEKLMEKNAEDRYQSAYGLKYDLEKSLNHQKEKDRIQTFTLAEKDISPELNIPQKLYGREKELSGILEIFQRASEDKLEVVLVSGYSGTGKSAIVQEIYKPITKRNGYFISGKFDQLQKDIPYSALVHAFTELVRQILTEPDENIESWKNKFLEVLSINAGVIIDVIPELGIILGDQPPVAELEPKESQNRFNLYFERFIHVLLKPEHPLVIFLDDLQWADSASLRFMQNLLTGDGVKHLLFIGAYRDNEVYAGHPFLEMIKDLEKINLPISNFLLKPLSGSDIINLLSDTFQTPNDKNRELSELLIKKTEGNPFFLRELLKSLYGDEKIQFSHSSGKWNWDIEEIQNAEITDNVVELMTSRLKKLPELTQEALKFASCIGSEFDSKTLSLISKKSIFDLATALMQAIEEGLILSHNNDHKFLLLQDKSLENIQINYKFVHDRIQQAAYLLIPEEQKLEFHREIGETYLKTLTEQEIEERIFDVVGHFNISMELIIEQEKSIKLVELNLLAGKRAKNSSAYEPSFNYLKIGIDLLGEKGWETHYQLMFNLHLEITEAAYLSTQFEEMSKYVEISKINVKTKIEKVKIIELELAFYMAKGNNQEIINLSKIALENLNFKFSLKPNIFQILYNYTYLKLILWNKNREFLLNLKENANIANEMIQKILSKFGSAMYYSNPLLGFYVNLKAMKLIIKDGSNKFSTYTLVTFAIISIAYLKDINSSFKISFLIQKLINKNNENNFQLIPKFILNNLLFHWKEDLNSSLFKLKEIFSESIELGNIEYASISITSYYTNCFFVGKNLKSLNSEIIEYHESLVRLKQIPANHWESSYLQVIENLSQKKENNWELTGNHLKEDKQIKSYKDSQDFVGLYNLLLLKLILCYLFLKQKESLLILEEFDDSRMSVPGSVLVSYFNFYESLTLLRECKNLKKPKIPNKVYKNQKKMKFWAEHAPMNRMHKYLLVEAEIAVIKKKYLDAMDLFDRSIALANENGFLIEEAITYELAGEFYLSIDKKEIGELYLKNSKEKYKKWGADSKVKFLEECYPFLKESQNIKSTVSMNVTTNLGEIIEKQSNLELNSILKFSRAISGEIQLENLISKLMKILLENAGAEKGIFILHTEKGFLIEATLEKNSKKEEIMQNIPLENFKEIPQSIINYVIRTKENIVLGDASKNGNFISDFFIESNKIKSILCIPIINQGKLKGIVYFENNLVNNAFTPNNINTLNLLTSQAAISLDNAILFSKIEEKSKEIETISKVKDEFLANLSHELKTPLTVVSAYSEMLKGGVSKPEKIQKFSDRIYEGAQKLNQYLNDLILVTNIESNLELQKDKININELIHKSIEQLNPLISEKRIQLELNFKENIELNCDPILLEKVFTAIIKNAIVYNKNEGSLIIETKKFSNKLEISFQDSGIGIADEFFEKIFERFFRIDSSLTYEVSGVGLGLFIAKKLIFMHSGSINIKSEIKNGSEFLISIPL